MFVGLIKMEMNVQKYCEICKNLLTRQKRFCSKYCYYISIRCGKSYIPRNTMLGKRHTSKTKELISKNCRGFSGKNHNKQTILKMKKSAIASHVQNKSRIIRLIQWNKSHTFSMDKNPNWKGGLTFQKYGYAFNVSLKNKIRKRDKYKCQICGTSELDCIRKLSIHHIDYDKKNNDLINLLATCNTCNARVNFNRNYWKIMLQKKMIEREIYKEIV